MPPEISTSRKGKITRNEVIGMKKLLLAISILAAVIIFGILSINAYKKSSKNLSDMVSKTSDLAVAGKWSQARTMIDEVAGKWEKTGNIWSLLIDHFEMDNIEMSMEKSKKYIDARDTPLSMAELESLRFMIEHIYEKEAFSLENIL
jgi:hypothetical protein